MACNFNIKVVEQNDFTICIPLKKRTFVASTPIDEDVDILALEDLSVKIGGAVFPATRDAAGVMVDVSRDALARGTYDVVLTATYKGHAIKAAYFDSLTIVEWNCQSDAQQCVQGSPIMFEAGFVIYNLTDAELAALKEEYRLKIAAAQRAKEEADAAKEEYVAKAEALDDVAQQSTLTKGVQDIREDISHIDIDTSNLAKQGLDAGATLTDTQAAATQAVSDAAAAKTAAQDAKQEAAQAAVKAAQAASGVADIQQYIQGRANLTGYTLSNDVDPTNISLLIYYRGYVRTINDPTITEINTQLMMNWATNVVSVTLPELVRISGRSAFDSLTKLQAVVFDKLQEITDARVFYGCNQLTSFTAPLLRSVTGDRCFSVCTALTELSLPALENIPSYFVSDCANLRRAHFPSVNSIYTSANFANDNKLIDLTLGRFTTNFNISTWSPTEALDPSSQSLLTQEDIAAGFTSNLQKLLYNIREHIAANLPVANNTVTFSSAVKAAILADQTTADAFTNKGWTIA